MRKLILATLAAFTVAAAATPAMAGDRHGGWHGRHHGHHNHWGHRHRGHSGVSFSFFAPAPVYYAPAPRVVQRTVYVDRAYDRAPVYVSSRGYDDQYCREYISNSRVGSRHAETYGTACMQPDGSWRVTN